MVVAAAHNVQLVGEEGNMYTIIKRGVGDVIIVKDSIVVK